MSFNYEEEANKLMLANENINRILDNYNDLLLGLNDKEKNVIQLYYYFQKLNTINNMRPKGNFYDDKKELYINKGIELIRKISDEFYPGVTNLEELKKTVMHDMNGKLIDIINNFSISIKKAYKEYCKNVYTILPVSGLTELVESKHRENQYLNSINDGVFATTTMESIEKYIARANVGGMIVRGNKIEYPSNPFSSVDGSELTLVKPVSIYLANVDYFEPQFDYEIDSEGKPHFIYGGEWIAPYEKVPCIERQTTYLPSSFLDNNVVYYYENGEKISISNN